MQTALLTIISVLCGVLIAVLLLLRAKFRHQTARLAELTAKEKELSAELRQTGEALHKAEVKLAESEATKNSWENQNLKLQKQADENQNVLNALAPVKEQLESFRKEVSSMEVAKHFGEITEQLRNAQQTDQRLLETTRSLESTMRDPKERGRWGELQLRRVVEASGMIEHIDYKSQAMLPGGQRPDMIVQLPGNKFIIIDSKVPMSAYYQSAQSGQDDHAGHAKALRSHIKSLSNKKYWEAQENSPELVVCFLPAESLFVNAIEADPDLLDYAFKHHVVLVSPITLVATLKAIAFAWRQNVATAEAKKFLTMVEALYKNLNNLSGSVRGLGNHLTTAINGYNKLVQNLNGHLVSNLRKMNNYDPVNFEMPLLEGIELKQLSKREYDMEETLPPATTPLPTHR